MNLYDIDGTLLAVVLLASLVVAMQVGHVLGRRLEPELRERIAGHVNLIQGSVLGLMALLLGFTFSLSLQRFDSRSEAAVNEANAIRTVYLRSELLPASIRDTVQESLRAFVDLRVQMVTASVRKAELDGSITEARRQLDALREQAVEAVRLDPGSPQTGPYVQAVNGMIGELVKRDAAMTRHVPETVLLLLGGTFVITTMIIGYATGVAGHRTSFVAYLMIGLIVILAYLIVDLDRPRSGLIQVSEKSLRDLQADMRADSPGSASQGAGSPRR
ncbi:MAG TPA: hypothetical protein VNH16_03370 [Burkholderiales bacterium]|nr:hypothetical protein [Burkholderiales bacterium]